MCAIQTKIPLQKHINAKRTKATIELFPKLKRNPSINKRGEEFALANGSVRDLKQNNNAGKIKP